RQAGGTKANSRFQVSGATARKAAADTPRSRRGTRLTAPASRFAQKYRLYPANSSSPPSPDNATVTCLRVNSQTRQVGICDESANGSANKAGRGGMTSSA